MEGAVTCGMVLEVCGEVWGEVWGGDLTRSPPSLVEPLHVSQELRCSYTGSIMQLPAEAVLGMCGTVEGDASGDLLHSGHWHAQELSKHVCVGGGEDGMWRE